MPGLYQDYREGKLKARTATPLDEPEAKNFISIQQPALFDFARGSNDLLNDASSDRVQTFAESNRAGERRNLGKLIFNVVVQLEKA